MESKHNEDRTELKNCIVGVIGFALYFIMSYSITLPLSLLGIDYANMNIYIKQAYLILYNIITMLMFIYLYKSILVVNFKDFKKNWKTYFKKYFKYWLIAIGVMYVSNIIIVIIKYLGSGAISIAGNEENIRETLTKAPYYTFFSAVFYAPIVEELTFRLSIRKIFKNEWIFIIVSAFIFGGMHVFSSITSWTDLLYLIPYCAPG